MSNKKRRHHYIWRHYLKPWLDENKVNCLRDGKTFQTDLMNIGQQRDFYKLKDLNAEDVDFIWKLAIEPAQGHLKKLHINLINNFTSIFKIKSALDSKGIDDAEINHIIDLAIHNLEEDLHGGIENIGEKYLQLLYEENTEFWANEDDAMYFSYFISVQYMRTHRMKEAILSQFEGELRDRGIKVWNILAHIFATNIGWSFYRDRASCSLVLLKNDTSTNFITGDQPCINMKSNPKDKNDAPEQIELYYPISPNLAVLLKEGLSDTNVISLSDDDVKKYNSYIENYAHEQLYAISPNDLEPFIK